MRSHTFTAGEFYHIYIHAIEARYLFNDEDDYKRFLVAMFVFNGTLSPPRLDRFNDLNLVYDIRDGEVDIGDSIVDLVSFCFMPTHAHLILKAKEDANISKFMHRLQVSYSKYYNQKYQRRGHVFERTFNSRHLDNNDYLLTTSCYLHLNPKSLSAWGGKEHLYPWSSYQDFIAQNRWGNLIKRDIVLSQFSNAVDYQHFIEEIKDFKDFDADAP
ncbi:MAG: transposase [Patescibacteria group bacterium]